MPFQGDKTTREEFVKSGSSAWTLPQGTATDDVNGESTIHDSEWEGYPLQQQVFHRIDLRLGNPFSDSNLSALLEAKIRSKGIQVPPCRLVKYLMAKNTLTRNVTGKRSWYWEWENAFRILWHHEEKWAEVEKAADIAEKSKLWQAALSRVEKHHPKNPSENYIQADVDAASQYDEGIYRPVPEGTIYVALDKNYQVLYLHFPEALQYIYQENVLPRIVQDICTYAYHEPPPSPDDKRHPRHDLYLKENPRFRPAVGACGVYHIGSWHSTGHPNGYVNLTHDTCGSEVDIVRLRLDLLKGAMGPLSHAAKMFMEIADPDMAQEYAKVFQHTPHAIATIKGEIFTLRAILVNVKTDSHVDSSDWEKGFAVMMPMGKFEGGSRSLIRVQTDANHLFRCPLLPS